MNISSLVNSAYFKPLVLTKVPESKSGTDYNEPANPVNNKAQDFASILKETTLKNSNGNGSV
ncbi:hypothetical protein [Phosphitispora sp. TUW77]|uniref:hypothetical protein n=1 Tax=Phosphitispora sp. TUW77 TaxID=3152361 RepID=UPI003AB825CA